MDYPTDHPTRELDSQDLPETGIRSQTNPIEEIVVPVMREEIEVHKERRKTGTVRVRKTVRELEETINETLASETATIERVPVNLLVDSPPPIRTEGDVTIIPIVKEELVVVKQLRVVEELRISRQQSVSEYQEKVAVRAEEVTIERESPAETEAAELR